jgi:hypothetical protein
MWSTAPKLAQSLPLRIGEMDHALDEIQSDHEFTVAKTERRIDAVVTDFQQLPGSLRDQPPGGTRR